MSEPRVSVIMANWNGANHLRVCLPSLRSQSFQSLEIVVVDNRSSDDSADMTNSFGARWLHLEENVGLAPALNRGAAIAAGDLLLFVNNDMRFEPKFVAKLIEPLASDEGIFATDGMQFNWDGTVRGHMAARLTNVRPPQRSSVELVPGLYFSQHEESVRTPVFMASAACMMVRRTLFEKLGGFDERLPFGYEDVEICWRAWLRRWKTLYVPDAICWHRVGSSVQSRDAERFAFRGVLKGRLLFSTKLLPARYAVRTWMVSTAGLAKDISRLKWKFTTDRMRVLFEMAGLVPQLLRERRVLFRSVGRSAEEQLEFQLRQNSQ
jgi:GT2 family glycosyltransferase